jgi:hypothetical protein
MCHLLYHSSAVSAKSTFNPNSSVPLTATMPRTNRVSKNACVATRWKHVQAGHTIISRNRVRGSRRCAHITSPFVAWAK